jgi:hypothetical protein
MSLSQGKISVYTILENNISEEDIENLKDLNLLNESLRISKINLILLKQKNIKEEKLFDYKGLEYLLSNSNNLTFESLAAFSLT